MSDAYNDLINQIETLLIKIGSLEKQISIMKNCLNFKHVETYAECVDQNNHCCDAARYVTLGTRDE